MKRTVVMLIAASLAASACGGDDNRTEAPTDYSTPATTDVASTASTADVASTPATTDVASVVSASDRNLVIDELSCSNLANYGHIAEEVGADVSGGDGFRTVSDFVCSYASVDGKVSGGQLSVRLPEAFAAYSGFPDSEQSVLASGATLNIYWVGLGLRPVALADIQEDSTPLAVVTGPALQVDYYGGFDKDLAVRVASAVYDALAG